MRSALLVCGLLTPSQGPAHVLDKRSQHRCVLSTKYLQRKSSVQKVAWESYLGVSRVWSRRRIAIGSPRARYVDGWSAPREKTWSPVLSSSMGSPRWTPTPTSSPSARSPRELGPRPFVAAPLLRSSPTTTSSLTVVTVLAFGPARQPAHRHRGRQRYHQSAPRSLIVLPRVVGGHLGSLRGSKEAERWEVVGHPSS